MGNYFKLALAAILPVIVSVILFYLDNFTKFGRLNIKVKYVIWGIIFGGIAIIGTEFGIPINGAQVNCRDAAVLIAGLFFGGPSGIIAGFIGGIERWLAVYWGVGAFTRLACSVSTIIAGFYAAALHKYMFDKKKPGWFIAGAMGVVMEIFHLSMVFITNMDNPSKAMTVVKACTAPMVIANGVSVLLAGIIVSIIAKEKLFPKKTDVRISQTIQRWLFATIVIAFYATSLFVFSMQNTLAETQASSLLDIGLTEVSNDVSDASDKNLLEVTNRIAADIEEDSSISLQSLMSKYEVSEISIVNSSGIIVQTTNPNFLNFDFNSGEQSREFLCLLKSTKEYVQAYGPISFNDSIYRKYAGVKYGDGFIQVGYDSYSFQKDVANAVRGITSNRHLGESGFMYIVDSNGTIASAPRFKLSGDMVFDTSVFKNNKAGEIFEYTFSNEVCLCKYKETESFYIVSALPKEDAYEERNIAIYVNTFMEVLVFAALFTLIFFLIKRVVVNQLKHVNKSLGRITKGDLNEVVNVRSNVEFASLSDDINSTVSTLKDYITAAEKRIDDDLIFAKNIQSSVLPEITPAIKKHKEFDIYASMNPAKEVGGDFFDFYITEGNKLNFMVGDVSGKGIPAAMFMMRARTELRSLTETEMPLNEVFTNSNNALCEGNGAGMFVTAWQGGLDLSNGLVTFVNAGHNPPLVRHKDGKFEYLKSRCGFVLAGMDGINYKTAELQLEIGDIIYLYTDGVTEATNANNELYGEPRLLDALNSKEFESMEELCKFIKADVDEFVGEAPQFDDITMVAVKYFGEEVHPQIVLENAEISDVTRVTEFVEEQMELAGCSMKTITQIDIAIDEIFSNIVKYGYKNKKGDITVMAYVNDERKMFYVKFIDSGIPYNPLTAEDPDITLSAEERGVGGLGIYMVKKTMDIASYKYLDDHNIFTIGKKL